MHRKLLFAGAILLVAALAAMAADAVTGKWRMEQEGFGGGPTRVSTLDLKADGATLTGTLTQPGFGQPGDAPPPPTTTPRTLSRKARAPGLGSRYPRQAPRRTLTAMTTHHAGMTRSSLK